MFLKGALQPDGGGRSTTLPTVGAGAGGVHDSSAVERNEYRVNLQALSDGRIEQLTQQLERVRDQHDAEKRHSTQMKQQVYAYRFLSKKIEWVVLYLAFFDKSHAASINFLVWMGFTFAFIVSWFVDFQINIILENFHYSFQSTILPY